MQKDRPVLTQGVDAFRTLVAEYGPAIRAFLAGHLDDPATVDDLAQETFIAAYEGFGRFEAQADPGPWLKGIARHRLLTHLRRAYQHGKALERIRAQVLLAVGERVATLQESDTPDTLDQLRDCLSRLPEHVQSVVRARHVERERVTSIARRLQTTAVAISSLLFRGRKLLEDCISRRG